MSMAIEMIRCPACKGTKKVAGLGMIVNDCTMCFATGKIKASDKPKPIEQIVEESVKEVIAEVSKQEPTILFNDELVNEIKEETKQAVEDQSSELTEDKAIAVNDNVVTKTSKRAIYRKKAISK